jgi:hypothetical protein
MELVDEFLGIQILKTTLIKLLKPNVVHLFFLPNYSVFLWRLDARNSFLVVVKWIQAGMRRTLPSGDWMLGKVFLSSLRGSKQG